MNDFPLLPTRSSSPRDRSLAAAANDAARGMDRLADALDEWGETTLARAARLWSALAMAGVRRVLSE